MINKHDSLFSVYIQCKRFAELTLGTTAAARRTEVFRRGRKHLPRRDPLRREDGPRCQGTVEYITESLTECGVWRRGGCVGGGGGQGRVGRVGGVGWCGMVWDVVGCCGEESGKGACCGHTLKWIEFREFAPRSTFVIIPCRQLTHFAPATPTCHSHPTSTCFITHIYARKHTHTPPPTRRHPHTKRHRGTI